LEEKEPKPRSEFKIIRLPDDPRLSAKAARQRALWNALPPAEQGAAAKAKKARTGVEKFPCFGCKRRFPMEEIARSGRNRRGYWWYLCRSCHRKRKKK